jgi:hypothetical protein
VAPESARDDYPTEVFQPFRDDEPDEHGEYADPGHWQPSAADESGVGEPVAQPDTAEADEVHADQATARIDPEYPTQVIEAYRDEPEHDGSGYQRDGEYADAGHDGASYDNTGYDGTGYDNAGYTDAGYTDAGHDGTGYDSAGHDGASYDNAGYDEQGYAQPDQGYTEQGYQEQGYSDGRQGYQEAPEGGYATEATHDGSGYAETGYDGAGHEGASYDGVSYDADGYPEQGHTEQDHSEQGYDAGYAQGGYQEAGYADDGHGQGAYEEAGYEQTGYASDGHAQPDAGYADAGYADAGYADADYAEPAPAPPADEPVPVAEQLFGNYHPGSDEYVDTAIIARITDHGTILDDGEGEQSSAAEGHATEQGTVEDHGHDTYGHDEYGHEEYGQSSNGQSSNGQSTNGQSQNGQLPTGHPDYPTAEQPAADLFDDDPADEAQPEAAAQQRNSGPNDGGQRDGTDAGENDRVRGAGALAAAPAAGLLAAAGSVAAVDSAHAGEPELLAGYSGDEGARAGSPAVRDDDDEGRTELIPRYIDGAKQSRPAVLAMVLLVVAVVATGAGFFSWSKAQQADRAQPTGNIAFLNKPATAEVKDQVSKAIEAIYSYDSAQLDQSESRALSFITGSYTDEFKANFATVRQLGPQEKASLVSTVVGAGVESLTESRATLLVMVNQVGHRGDNPQPLRAAVRLNVTAQKVDGQWKVSGVNQK